VSAIKVDVRIIAATHRDLPAMVKRGEFRQDLFYRLHVACLRVPPLRDRRDDIPDLAEQALRELAEVYGEPVKSLSDDARHALSAHDWPGNVRELFNAIEHAVVFSSGEQIQVDDLPESMRPSPIALAADACRPLTLDAAEREVIALALRNSNGNQSEAARTLGIERHRLRRRIVHHELLELTRLRAL
jgi:two-component system, NtrC family, response regulator HydG